MKEIFRLMINPFTRIAGWQAFGLGMIFILLMGWIASLSGVYFDGVLDVHISGAAYPVSRSYLMLALDILCLVTFMWMAGLIFSKKFRFIDILGTMTLSKAPMLVLSFFGFMVNKSDLSVLAENPMAAVADPSIIFNSISIIVFGLLTIPFAVWNIALMYNAFKVSCDIKKNRIVPVFIVALLLSEILSKILIGGFFRSTPLFPA